MKDLIFRTAKCFIFAFLGVFIPELCCVLSGTLPSDFHSFALLVIPMLCASLSSGLSAAWNFVVKRFDHEFVDPNDIVEIDGVEVEFTADGFIPLINNSAERDVESTSCAE